MCETDNLIDLSDLEETSMGMQQNSSTSNPSISCFLQRSFDNNPFDSMQNLANRQDDPFDIVEKEAFTKAFTGAKLNNSEVKVGNLLTIDDDSLDLLIGGNNSVTNEQSGNKTFWNTDYAQMSSECTNNTTDSGDHTESEASSNGEMSKSKNYLESRKKLLKLSITNSTFNSPMSRPFTRQTSGEAFPENDGYCSPISSLYSQILQLNEPMLEVESPLKLIEDDLLMEEPPVFLDSDKDFEAELEMLKIPMLKKLPSLPGEQNDTSISAGTETPLNAVESESLISMENVLPDLVALRAKLNTIRSDAKLVANVNVTDSLKHQDIVELVQHLKLAIYDIDFEDDIKKQKATSLLKSLSSALTCNSAMNQHSDNIMTIPQSIVRQGTFDMDTKEMHKQEEDCKDYKLKEANVIHQEQSINLGVENIPDVMLKSSATYDCETADEKDNYELPECNDYPQSPSPAPTHVNDLIEQLNKLCEQNFLNTNVNQNSEEPGGSIHSNNTSTVNPTFIFVMPPSTVLPPYMNASRQASPDFSSSNTSSIRRRSQSLSLHDKVKIMQLPIEPNHEMTSDSNDFSTNNTPPNVAEFKTPMRSMQRRNSFSNGSPVNTVTRPNSYTIRRSYFGNDAVSHLSTNFSRSSTVLSPHAEKKEKQRMVVLPITQSNMNLLKPDLKRRTRTNASNSSILKSTVPLKATIPIKKVTPLVMTAAATSTDVRHEHQLHAKFETPNSVKLNTNFPKACSTPTNITRTPVTRNSIAATKPRYSSVNNATTSRSVLAQNTSSLSRRRSIAEQKMKSPVKLGRQSLNGNSISHITKSTAKGITGIMPPGPSRSSKSSAVAASRKMIYRLGSVTEANATKCKENKKP